MRSVYVSQEHLYVGGRMALFMSIASTARQIVTQPGEETRRIGAHLPPGDGAEVRG